MLYTYFNKPTIFTMWLITNPLHKELYSKELLVVMTSGCIRLAYDLYVHTMPMFDHILHRLFIVHVCC